MKNSLFSLYKSAVFKYPKWVLVIIVALLAILSPYASNFRMDASSDTLILENDQSLKYYRDVVAKYDASDFLVLTYSPHDDLFSDAVLKDLRSLRENISALDDIKSILSILDVPLTQSPPVSLAELNSAPQLLLDEKTDRLLAKKELTGSQLYRDLLVSDDYSTTAVIISLKRNTEVSALQKRRNDLREQRSLTALNKAEALELREVTLQHQEKASLFQKEQSKMIEDVRNLASAHQGKAEIFLGGLPMIVSDSTNYIKDDVLVFGAAALIIIVLILAIAFRQPGWIVIPLITCFITGYIIVCLLGLLNWPISVVSANFLSLLLIITLSLNIHLIVRYRELADSSRSLQTDHRTTTLLAQTVRSKFIPCVYTSLTTMVAFASLIVSGIRPVIDFGYIMCLGILLSLLTTFILLPALVLIFKPTQITSNREKISESILSLANSLHDNGVLVTITFTLFSLFAGYGILNLSVENRFIDYFKADTEIYQGMHKIDEKLGGTTPLDIILDAPTDFLEQYQQLIANQDSAADDSDEFEDEFSDFEEDIGTESGQAKISATSGYWYNQNGLQKIKAIQQSLEALPETGKVMSLATTMSLFENLKGAGEMDDIDLGFMYGVLSDRNKQTLFEPYMSADANQLHINIRVFESDKGLDRNKLITDIRQTLITEHGIDDKQINISGMLVLYNNMLNSLFSSQILTLGTVFLVIFLMFMVLFRNIKLALITIIPNVFSAAVVLGLMGLFNIPLDLMTITIAAISVGIAVDNSIHFAHRTSDEFNHSHSYNRSIKTATDNVGQAMFYTTLVITAGFMIMVFSNFVPTMYFGILTAIAMVTALIANLIMLPMLISRFRPLVRVADKERPQHKSGNQYKYSA